MGRYYKAVCDDLRESIDPGEINDLGVKQYAIAHPRHPFGQLVVFAMVTRWDGHGVRLQDDTGTNDVAYNEYTNITKSVIEEYNAEYADAYKVRYTGED